MGPNTVETLTEAPLPYLLITAVKAIDLRKACLKDMQNLKTVC